MSFNDAGRNVHPYGIWRLEELLRNTVDFLVDEAETGEGLTLVRAQLKAIGFTPEEMDYFGFPDYEDGGDGGSDGPEPGMLTQAACRDIHEMYLDLASADAVLSSRDDPDAYMRDWELKKMLPSMGFDPYYEPDWLQTWICHTEGYRPCLADDLIGILRHVSLDKDAVKRLLAGLPEEPESNGRKHRFWTGDGGRTVNCLNKEDAGRLAGALKEQLGDSAAVRTR